MANTRQLAKFLGVTPDTIYRWRREGVLPEMPHHDDKGHVFWTPEQVTNLLRWYKEFSRPAQERLNEAVRRAQT